MQAVRSVGLDRLKRFVCLLLIFVLLFCFFMCPRASAVALEVTTIAYGGLLVGTILVGAGVVFSSHGDMVKVGNAMYKTLVNGSSAIGNGLGGGTWCITGWRCAACWQEFVSGIVDAFNASYSDGAFKIADGVVTLADGADNASCLAAAGAIKDLLALKQDCTLYIDFYSEYGEHIQEYRSFIYSDSGLTTKVIDCSTGKTSQSFLPYSDYNAAFWAVRESRCGISYGHSEISFGFWVSEDGGGTSYTYRAPLSVSYAVAIPQPDLKYPSDDYLVRMPDIPSVDTSTGDVTYPNDTAYTKDAVTAPYPIGDDGVRCRIFRLIFQSIRLAVNRWMIPGTDMDTPSKPGEGDGYRQNRMLTGRVPEIYHYLLIISKFPFHSF